METSPPPAPTAEKPWKISRRITPARIGPLYKVGAVLTALAMLLLPMLYLGLIAGVAWELYDRCMNAGTDPDESSQLYFILPIGVILLVSMIKPLFARRAKTTPPVEITREQEPQLFAFIDQICALVRAPRPKRVVVDLKVNASASFARGFLGLARNHLTLTVGLPLVTGLTVRQLGGVFAHEFGHFAQGAGMRLTYIIRSVNAWFGRLVYERDSWDSFLREAARRIDIRIGIIFYLAMLIVWITRKILWLFMWLGHGISCFMLRQMEYDADSYEIQVAGSDAFLATCQALPVIGAGWQRAVSRQQDSFATHRLVDDLATYTALETKRVSPETKAEIVKAVKGAKTGWFDTHPTDFDRMRIAFQAKAPGVLSGEESATALFSDFSSLARQSTAAYYRHDCEIELSKVQLVPLDQVAGEAEALAEADKATQLFYGGLPTIRTFIAFGADDLYQTSSLGQLQAEVRNAISRQSAAMGAVPDCVKALLAADRAGTTAMQARTLISAGFKIKPAVFGIGRADVGGADAAMAAAEASVVKHRGMLADALRATRDRMAGALRVYFLKPAPATFDASVTDEVERLARIAGAIAGLGDRVANLRTQIAACGLLLQNHSDKVGAKYVAALRSAGSNIGLEARAITSSLTRLEYPFGHAQEHVPLSEFLWGTEKSHADESVDFYLRGQAVLDRLLTVYHRTMGRLAQLAFQGEAALEVEVPPPAPPEMSFPA